VRRSVPGQWGNYSVLVLDDNEIFLSVECDLIQRAIGNGLAGTTSEREAFAIAEAHRPELILVDLDMPGTHGAASISWFRRQLPTSKIIATSMLAGEAIRRAAVEAGADELIDKADLHGQRLFDFLAQVRLKSEPTA
jgi:DNA-binding NarL/FixJ family response regulator